MTSARTNYICLDSVKQIIKGLYDGAVQTLIPTTPDDKKDDSSSIMTAQKQAHHQLSFLAPSSPVDGSTIIFDASFHILDNYIPEKIADDTTPTTLKQKSPR